ncbi:glycosyltransferase involved in cell wall biosynthesis [Solibacillus kalamii]|uniref:Glycosyl transferase n=1 Tax=Solibacillus kalamii TaxID=1748298 RepID=A0ABX3ZMG0_9BACL|nr:glycosyltransferase [Solibacillus kalamii]MBM7664838.1 glycosyltransferase involved in cell wall biosynthesis [Solibacillus kalamii]OUZ40787.1 glycosyl transferase [Solibacillus kalamii]
MKKVFVISNMYPSKEHLAYGIFVKNQVEQLEREGIDTVLAVNTNPATGKKNVILKYLKWAQQFMRVFRANKRNISLTHSHYVFPSGIFSYYLKKRHNIPYIVTAHGGDINKMAKKGGQIREFTEKILQSADHVIAVGEELAATIETTFHVENDKISVMSMGIDRTVFNKADDKKQHAKELGMDPDKTNFLFVGNIIREKGVTELVRAFNKVTESLPQQATLYCVGSTKDSNFTSKVKELARDNTAIHFIEPLPQQELARYFQAADVFVLPSYIEGLGLVALEAMSCGTPVIASDVGGLHYMLADGAGVLVPPKDEILLQLALENAVKDGITVNEARVVELLHSHDAKNIIARLKVLYTTHAK